MRAAILLLIATFLVAGIVAQIPGAPKPGQFNISSFSANGFDAIVLDTPSWVTSIERSHRDGEFYVFGRETLRPVHSGPNASDFYADVIPWTQFALRFTDLHTFTYTDNTGVTYLTTFGLAPFDINQMDAYVNTAGTYIPWVAVRAAVGTSGNPSVWVQPITNQSATAAPYDLNGYMFSAVKCDEYSQRASGMAIVYFAGFRVNDDLSADFVLVRTYFNLEISGMTGAQWGPFSFNATEDVWVLYPDKFAPYSVINKPWIHLVNSVENGVNVTLVVVVDPNTKTVYGVNTNSNSTSYFSVQYPEARYDFVSTVYDYWQQVLIVGVSAEGFEDGKLWLFNFSTIPTTVPEPFAINLPLNYSNPKALAMEFNHLYVGFNGYNQVLRINLWNSSYPIDGYQSLPEYLHRSWAATITPHHVYFVSNEQHSKVYRVDKRDFCPSTCPWFGFCKGGQCTCADGFELNKEKTECLLKVAEDKIHYVDKYHTAHGGEVALGILFALSFIAAAAGWFMWWRGGRRGAYQAV